MRPKKINCLVNINFRLESINLRLNPCSMRCPTNHVTQLRAACIRSACSHSKLVFIMRIHICKNTNRNLFPWFARFAFQIEFYSQILQRFPRNGVAVRQRHGFASFVVHRHSRKCFMFAMKNENPSKIWWPQVHFRFEIYFRFKQHSSFIPYK